MTTSEQKYRLRFFFDYGAGGCLWADNDLATQKFGVGPIDQIIADKLGKISTYTLTQIKELDNRHAKYYNKDYPLDPSLWRQDECDNFNEKIDALLNSLTQQLQAEFEIVDKQERYSEDKDLEEYLKDTRNFKRAK